ncbi:hypothetical protein A8C56_22780 [Niabella ginsenosidivorans]|uniref:Protein BatD n=1 Tax=Niabella ginsenosidivorans TaxID=1176587 RepID=A0A1A9I920_9BACT|nr:hypothetical protein A8C56_22780 [Niabella ginsenosidivorans]
MKQLVLWALALMASPIVFAQNSTLDARIKNNLYLNVYVNKTNCYVGEPIVVTYKLYSSLESVSEVIKDPDFAGFELRDLIASGDDIVNRQTIDGKSFDVHTLRKIQLTPLEAGRLVLDPMILSNRIRLIDASGNRSSLLDGIDDSFLKNGEYRVSIASVPITVNVQEAPANAKPAVYNGAVGDFKMNVRLSKVNLNPGEQGSLLITISGTGDFSRVTQPVVQWPSGVTAATATVQEQYDRNDKNAPGVKIFTFPFSSSKVGAYTIMPVQFSYFDAVRNRYNTVSNPPVTFYVREGAVNAPAGAVNTQAERNDHYGALLLGIGIVALLLLILLLRKMFRNKGQQQPMRQVMLKQQVQPVQTDQPGSGVEELLQPAEDAVTKPGSLFYTTLRQGMIRFFEQKYQVPAKLFYKSTLKETMTQRKVPVPLQDEVFHMLTEIEMNIYSAGGMEGDRVRLLEKTKAILKKL